MATINLRDYYPFYQHDMLIEVTDEVAAQLQQEERNEKAYQRKKERYRAYYSLDCGDGLERKAIFTSVSPDERYQRKVTYEQLYGALSALPEKQAKRIYAHFLMGISQAEIARAEGVSSNAVNLSISRGLKRLERYLKNIF